MRSRRRIQKGRKAAGSSRVEDRAKVVVSGRGGGRQGGAVVRGDCQCGARLAVQCGASTAGDAGQLVRRGAWAMCRAVAHGLRPVGFGRVLPSVGPREKRTSLRICLFDLRGFIWTKITMVCLAFLVHLFQRENDKLREKEIILLQFY